MKTKDIASFNLIVTILSGQPHFCIGLVPSDEEIHERLTHETEMWEQSYNWKRTMRSTGRNFDFRNIRNSDIRKINIEYVHTKMQKL